MYLVYTVFTLPADAVVVVTSEAPELRPLRWFQVVLDGYYNGVERQQMPIKWLKLSALTCKIERGARQKTLRKAIEGEDLLAK